MKNGEMMGKRLLCACAAPVIFLCGVFFALADQSGPTPSNEQIIFDYITGTMKLNEAAACGILANIQAESNFNPNAGGPDTNGLTSYGICQWNGSRFTALQDYCTANGLDYTTLDGQLAFLCNELQTTEAWTGTLSYIQAATNDKEGAYNAGYYWCLHFERPAGGETSADKRGTAAAETFWPKYAPMPVAGEKWQVNSSNGVNLRSGAGLSNPVLTVVPDKTFLYVTAKQAADSYTWGKVVYNDVTGWVALDFATYVNGALPTLGDVNLDGSVDTIDVRLVLQAVVDKIKLTDDQSVFADVNRDGSVDTIDARLILQKIVGKITDFPEKPTDTTGTTETTTAANDTTTTEVTTSPT